MVVISEKNLFWTLTHPLAAPVCGASQLLLYQLNQSSPAEDRGGRGSLVMKKKVSVTIEKMRTVTILILAVVARAAEGETRLFKVSGDDLFDGLYAADEAVGVERISAM